MLKGTRMRALFDTSVQQHTSGNLSNAEVHVWQMSIHACSRHFIGTCRGAAALKRTVEGRDITLDLV